MDFPKTTQSQYGRHENSPRENRSVLGNKQQHEEHRQGRGDGMGQTETHTCCWILASSSGGIRLICSWAILISSGSIIIPLNIPPAPKPSPRRRRTAARSPCPLPGLLTTNPSLLRRWDPPKRTPANCSLPQIKMANGRLFLPGIEGWRRGIQRGGCVD